MKRIEATQACPGCSQPLSVSAMSCAQCEVKIEASFELNEFARLSADDLHFLRIFVRCEGKVREMEAALGLSYPTIRTRLATFKEKVEVLGEVAVATETLKPQTALAPQSTAEVLERLKAGQISYDQALKEIKSLKKF